MDSTEVTTLSLCAGYGGIDLGLKRVLPTCRTVAYVEIEAFACANLVAKMEAGQLAPAPIWTNLKSFDGRAFRGRVDILTGGFPCQPFSASGLRLGDDDPRHLFPDVLRTIRAVQPGWVFLENVEGLITTKLKGGDWGDVAGTPVLLHVLRGLERAGYRATWGIFSAAEVGATHQRKRVFILAHAHNGGGSQDRQPGELRPGRTLEPPRDRWPARPGEDQEGWEEPRTRPYGEVKPRLAGATDGATVRLDRLRLLGNGVVPAVAAMAFATLWGHPTT